MEQPLSHGVNSLHGHLMDPLLGLVVKIHPLLGAVNVISKIIVVEVLSHVLQSVQQVAGLPQKIFQCLKYFFCKIQKLSTKKSKSFQEYDNIKNLLLELINCYTRKLILSSLYSFFLISVSVLSDLCKFIVQVNIKILPKKVNKSKPR